MKTLAQHRLKAHEDRARENHPNWRWSRPRTGKRKSKPGHTCSSEQDVLQHAGVE